MREAARIDRDQDLLGVEPVRVAELQVGPEHRRVLLDRREEAIEVVRHASSELADGAQLLGLADLLLELTLARDVDAGQEEAVAPAAIVGQRRRVPVDDPPLAGGARHRELHADDVAGASRGQLGEDTLPVATFDEDRHPVAPQHVSCTAAEDLLPLPID